DLMRLVQVLALILELLVLNLQLFLLPLQRFGLPLRLLQQLLQLHSVTRRPNRDCDRLGNRLEPVEGRPVRLLEETELDRADDIAVGNGGHGEHTTRPAAAQCGRNLEIALGRWIEPQRTLLLYGLTQQAFAGVDMRP